MTPEPFTIGAPIITKHSRLAGVITGYALTRQKYMVTLEGGRQREFSATSLCRAEPPMRGEELMDEVEFLLGQGQSPLLIPGMVRHHPEVIARWAREYKRPVIRDAFNAAGKAEYLRKKGFQ